MAVDKDMSHSLSKSELGTLIWLLSGEEPKESNLNSTIEKLDANGDSAIELSEWLDFLATKDYKGRKVMNYTLKQKFDLYDEDGNGSISIDELEKMVIDSFSDLISKAEGHNKKMAESVVRDLAKIVMQKMDFNSSNNLDVDIYIYNFSGVNLNIIFKWLHVKKKK
jgi:Ca2+-binding EF-hand superfamily protein